MAPSVANKNKGKAREGRQSRSRHTTPGSVVSMALSANVPAAVVSAFDFDLAAVFESASASYHDLLEQHGGGGSVPDSRSIGILAGELASLSALAGSRETACDRGMRELSARRKIRIEHDRDMEQANREAEEKAHLKRIAEDDEIEKAHHSGKTKRRKEGKPREERPLAHGAHSVARQDGLIKGKHYSCSVPSSFTFLALSFGVRVSGKYNTHSAHGPTARYGSQRVVEDLHVKLFPMTRPGCD